MVKALPGFAGNEEPAALLAHKVGQGAVEPCGIYEMVGLHVTPEDKIDSFGAGIVIPGAEELPSSSGPPCLTIRNPDLRTRSRSSPSSPVTTIDTVLSSFPLWRFDDFASQAPLPTA